MDGSSIDQGSSHSESLSAAAAAVGDISVARRDLRLPAG